tara:strand:+ start:389 stop:694 length:306 start_codon:yes stop_codon:yes gene_type:complete
MKKIIIAITICVVGGFILAQYPKTPHIKPPIPADIDQALLTWAIINAATKEQKECNLYIDRYQLSTTTDGQGMYIFESVIDTYTGEIVSRKKIDFKEYAKN